MQEHLTPQSLELAKVIGERIRAQRTKVNVGVGEINDKTGLTRTGLQYIEVGKRLPSIGLLCKLAKLLQTSTDALLGLEALEEPSAARKPGRPKKDELSTSSPQ